MDFSRIVIEGLQKHGGDSKKHPPLQSRVNPQDHSSEPQNPGVDKGTEQSNSHHEGPSSEVRDSNPKKYLPRWSESNRQSVLKPLRAFTRRTSSTHLDTSVAMAHKESKQDEPMEGLYDRGTVAQRQRQRDVTDIYQSHPPIKSINKPERTKNNYIISQMLNSNMASRDTDHSSINYWGPPPPKLSLNDETSLNSSNNTPKQRAADLEEQESVQNRCMAQSPPKSTQPQKTIRFGRSDSGACEVFQQPEMESLRESHMKRMDSLQRVIDQEDVFHRLRMSDSEILGHIGDICLKVRTFASKVAKMSKNSFFLDKAGQTSRLTDRIKYEIKMVAPIPDLSIDSILAATTKARNRRFLIQGWIHFTLWNSIFRSNLLIEGSEAPRGGNPSDLWLPEAKSAAVERLENEFSSLAQRKIISQATFHKWRTLTLGIISSVNPQSDGSGDNGSKTIEARCQNVAEVLQELILGRCQFENGSIQEESIGSFKRYLVEIFNSALSLSSRLRTQRAAFGLRFPTAPPSKSHFSEPLHLDTDWMQTDDGCDELSPQRIVSYVIEPAWFKAGDANGEGYDFGAGCFVKARVVCLPATAPPETVHKDPVLQEAPAFRSDVTGLA
ncbi:hypothetical protein AOL_s00170g38 [Orbilia oligospora ATCC 24927]|uniref:Uncharacterized protein n=1 Tax=Arthrobotrys oligospora (strain ATCC 24927 / CBS 115.81 / DSM 1491) TaxID=756982 RepID=G1XN72_ARTOA|nr:hypothetical protein AOL_s00170g38 [Orbilia oligospora ATCC 24927]EGX45331.1 hypothetical protein AOL_s00170g38 [Orbilia oligospora ATCC 24927]